MFIWGSPIVRRFHGRLYVYYHPGDLLGVYRVDKGELLIPSALIDLARNWKIKRNTEDVRWPSCQPAQSRWLWTDTNGDGKMQPDEFENQPDMIDEVEFISGSWVDSVGNIWLCGSSKGIRGLWFLPIQKFDASGNPVYTLSSLRRLPLPKEFKQVERLVYQKESDAMYVAGETILLPKVPHFGSIGTEVIRYDHWSNPAPEIRWRIQLPNDPALPQAYFPAFTVSGDKVFCMMRRLAVIYTYDAHSGQLLGHLTPGPAVGSKSGWCDMENGVTAYTRSDGHTLVFAEDDLRSRIIAYDVNP